MRELLWLLVQRAYWKAVLALSEWQCRRLQTEYYLKFGKPWEE